MFSTIGLHINAKKLKFLGALHKSNTAIWLEFNVSTDAFITISPL